MMKRAVTMVATVTAVVALTATIGARPMPRLVWNVSESAPIGLYAVRSATGLAAGDLVVAYPPEELAVFLAERGYLPPGVPLIKHVVAVPGQTVCRNELLVAIEGRPVGAARPRDRKGRLLPVWQGCRVVAAGEVFLMNWNEPRSLDGRYFGPLPVDTIAGRAEPLWTYAWSPCASRCKHQLNSLRLGGRND